MQHLFFNTLQRILVVSLNGWKDECLYSHYPISNCKTKQYTIRSPKVFPYDIEDPPETPKLQNNTVSE